MKIDTDTKYTLLARCWWGALGGDMDSFFDDMPVGMGVLVELGVF